MRTRTRRRTGTSAGAGSEQLTRTVACRPVDRSVSFHRVSTPHDWLCRHQLRRPCCHAATSTLAHTHQPHHHCCNFSTHSQHRSFRNTLFSFSLHPLRAQIHVFTQQTKRRMEKNNAEPLPFCQGVERHGIRINFWGGCGLCVDVRMCGGLLKRASVTTRTQCRRLPVQERRRIGSYHTGDDKKERAEQIYALRTYLRLAKWISRLCWRSVMRVRSCCGSADQWRGWLSVGFVRKRVKTVENKQRWQNLVAERRGVWPGRV